MSIEALIQAHTEALLANTEAVKLLTLSLAGRSATAANKAADAVEKPKADPKPVAKKEEPKVEEKDPVEAADANNANNAKHVDDTAAEVLPYETARALVLKLAGAGKRAEIPQVFKAHGIDNLKKLLDKEDDFSTVNDQAKLEAVYADLQKLEG